MLPRLLIPVAEDFQFVSFTRDGLLRAVLAPLILARDANFIYSLLAYALPVLMLASPRQLRLVLSESRRWDRSIPWPLLRVRCWSSVFLAAQTSIGFRAI